MMRAHPLRLALLAAATLLPSMVQAADAPANTVGLELGADSLSNGSPDWHAATVRATHAFSERRLLDVAVNQTRRFGLTDHQLALAYITPLAQSLVATVDASASSHRVLAKNSAGVGLQYEFAPAWLVHGGVRSSGYDTVRVNQGLLMLERYVGNYSAALSWRPTRAFGTTAHGVALQAARYYGEKSSLGLILSSGREASSIPSGVAIGSVRAAALVGKHQINPAWSLNYSLSHTRQVGLYTRKGLSFGLAHAY